MSCKKKKKEKKKNDAKVTGKKNKIERYDKKLTKE